MSYNDIILQMKFKLNNQENPCIAMKNDKLQNVQFK